MSQRGYLNGVRLLGLKEMRAAAKPGECIACGDDAIPFGHYAKRTHQDTCGSPDCRVAWFRFWRRDKRNPPVPQHHVISPIGWRAMRRQRQSAGQRWRNAA